MDLARVLVVGSVAEDRILRLHAPMRAGAHIEGEDRGFRLGGGASNTGVALARAGHRAVLIATVGDDDVGARLVGELDAAGADTSQIRSLPGATTRSIVMVDEAGERTIVNLTRMAEPGPPERLLELAADCLYVRRRTPGLAPLLEAKAESCLVVAHMPPHGEGERPAHVLVASASDLPPGMLEAPFASGRSVAGDILQWVVITKGADGATAHAADRNLHVPAPRVTPVDTTGAGDVFAAGMIHGLVSGASMRQALEIGCRWGAQATQWDSSVPPPGVKLE